MKKMNRDKLPVNYVLAGFVFRKVRNGYGLRDSQGRKVIYVPVCLDEFGRNVLAYYDQDTLKVLKDEYGVEPIETDEEGGGYVYSGLYRKKGA